MGKNYVQNEAGIWLPAKGGPDGETIVRGTGPDGEIDVKQVGSNVVNERIDVIEPVSPVDTESIKNNIDISKFKKVYLYVMTDLDVDVNVELRINDFKNTASPYSRVYNFDENKWETTDGGFINIPSTNGTKIVYLINTAVPWLDSLINERFQIDIIPQSSPTSGSVSAYLMGVPN